MQSLWYHCSNSVFISYQTYKVYVVITVGNYVIAVVESSACYVLYI